MSKTYLIGGLAVLLVGAGGWYALSMQAPVMPSTPAPAPVAENETMPSNPAPGEETPAPAPEATAPVAEGPKEFTMAEVAAHASAESCYTTVGQNVYDATDWIAKHPGGEKAILGLCGKDGTAPFTKQHGTFAKAQEALATLQIGVLAK